MPGVLYNYLLSARDLQFLVSNGNIVLSIVGIVNNMDSMCLDESLQVISTNFDSLKLDNFIRDNLII